jgi:hypothetical protein
VPLNLTATPDAAKGTVQLSWEANPVGRRPVAYKVYGSDEQGFTASDTEHVVRMGHGFCDTLDEYNAKTRDDPYWGDVKTPANLAGKTAQTELEVVCPPGASQAVNLNKAFYRVVALDERGNESGASDYVALPRPFIYTAPVTAAKAGQEYRYAPRSLYSIGHLTCRDGYNAAFWEREKVTWSLEKGPAWLKLQDGVLVGTPPMAGQYGVTLRAAIGGQQQAQSFTIAVTTP